MRVDTAMPRTWLLAALAGWAVLVWLLALLGMGRHASSLDPDQAQLPPLPQPSTRASTPAPPLGQFDQIVSRPLFSDDRRPRPFSLQGDGGAESAQAFDFVLSSVLITPQVRLAILQSPDRSKSLRVKLGEAPESQPSWRLAELSPRSAVFEGPEGRRTMELRTFDGTGGEPPTAIAQPGATPVGQSVRAPQQQTQPQPQPAAPVPASARAAAAPAGNAERPGQQGPAIVAEPGSAAEAQATDQQMEAIRKRIEARRAQLRQQQQQQQKQQQTTPPARN